MVKEFLLSIFVAIHLQNVFSLPRQSDQKPASSLLIPDQKASLRQSKAPSILFQHQYFPTSLHVIPLQNIDNSQQNRKVTQLVPVYLSNLPVHHNYFVPIQDLQVIPLGTTSNQHNGHYRVMDKRNDAEELNRFRNFYGGYGQGLYFGGHGAGHGFYVYG